MKLLSGSSNLPLAKRIATAMSLELVERTITQFSNGEIRVHITDSVQGQEIVLVQSHSAPTDSMIIETLLLLDALERGGAVSVTLIIPWLGYSLQDKVFREGEPIASKVIASLISTAFVKRIYLLDLHNSSIQGFFTVPTTLISTHSLFGSYIKSCLNLETTAVASPDFGGIKKAARFAEELGIEMVTMGKKRNLDTGEITMTHLEGSPENKTILLFDDVIMSGSTALEAATQLKAQGAERVFLLSTHGVFVGDALEKLLFQSSAIDQIIITNSIHHQDLPEQITVLDCSSLFTTRMQ